MKYHTVSIVLFYFLIWSPYAAHAQENSPWLDLGLYGGQINTIAIDPELHSLIYAGSWNGDGFFKSTDSGATWSISAQKQWWFRNMEVYDISIDPHNPATIWAANNHFVDVSYDYGATWKTFFFADEEHRFCYAVKVDPHDVSGNTVYVGTGGPDGTDELGVIFKTTDGGASWSEKSNNFPPDYQPFNFWDIDINPNHPDEIWATSRKAGISPEGRIFMSPDGGEHWWSWNAALGLDGSIYFLSYLDEILVHPVDPLLMFAGDGYGVLIKTDGTDTSTGWSWITDKGSCRSLCIPHGNPDVIYAGLIDTTAKSTNRGTAWTYYDRPGEFLCLAADPAQDDILFGGDLNKGVLKSTDGAESWASANRGIKANQIIDSALSATTPQALLAGTVSGVYMLRNQADWTLINPSMGHAVLFHPLKKDTLYAGFFWELGKSTDNGSTWTYRDVSDAADAHLVSSIALSAQNPEQVFVGVSFNAGDRGTIIRITDTAGDLSTAPAEVVFETKAPVNSVTINPVNPQVLFAGTGHFFAPITSGSIYKSTDNGKTWHRALFKNLIVNTIAMSSLDQDLLYIGCGGSDSSFAGLYKSTDGGKTWREKIRGLPRSNNGDPAFAVTDMKIDDYNTSILYASLYRHGIYVSMDGGEYWTQIGLSDYTTFDVNVRGVAPMAQANRITADGSASLTIPSATVLAGTASGMYQYSTAGTGVLTGMITAQETNLPIDSAQVSAASGSTCISSEGYYLMLLPSGVHTLDIDAAGYEHATLAGITVQSGQSISRDISLTPRSDDSSCVASSLLRGSQNATSLHVLRAFRDRMLRRSSTGNRMIALYYAAGQDVLRALHEHPLLKKRCMQLIDKSIPVIATALGKKSLTIPSSLLNEVSLFLFDLEQVSPAELNVKISSFRHDLKQDGFFNTF